MLNTFSPISFGAKYIRIQPAPEGFKIEQDESNKIADNVAAIIEIISNASLNYKDIYLASDDTNTISRINPAANILVSINNDELIRTSTHAGIDNATNIISVKREDFKTDSGRSLFDQVKKFVQSCMLVIQVENLTGDKDISLRSELKKHKDSIKTLIEKFVNEEINKRSNP